MQTDRIAEIHEELKMVDRRITIKKLLDQKVGEHKFGECDQISEGIDELQSRRCMLTAELRNFEKK